MDGPDGTSYREWDKERRDAKWFAHHAVVLDPADERFVYPPVTAYAPRGPS
jgi:hypothetical protein